MAWCMGKFLTSRWWVGVFYAFWTASWWGIRPSQLPRNSTKNFLKSQMPGVLRGGSMGGFRICQYKMQTTDCCRPLFSPCNQNETKIVPLTVFKPWKQWSAVMSAVCILYCPVLEWTGTLVSKCVHKQSYINSRNRSLHQISTNSGKPTFDIFSFITSGPTDRMCIKASLLPTTEDAHFCTCKWAKRRRIHSKCLAA